MKLFQQGLGHDGGIARFALCRVGERGCLADSIGVIGSVPRVGFVDVVDAVATDSVDGFLGADATFLRTQGWSQFGRLLIRRDQVIRDVFDKDAFTLYRGKH